MNLIFSRTDALGDTLLSLVAPKYAKELFPEAKITFIAQEKFADVFECCPYIDEFVSVDSKKSFFSNLKKIRSSFKNISKDAVYFFLGGNHLVPCYFKSIGLSLRYGSVVRPIHYFLLNKGLRQKRSLVEMHEYEYNLEVFYEYLKENKIPFEYYQIKDALLKIKGESTPLIPQLDAQNKNWSSKYIIIHPGMTGHTLNWPTKYYVDLAQDLLEQWDGNIIFSYTPSDMKYIKPALNWHENLQEQGKQREEKENLKNRVLFYEGHKERLKTFMMLIKNSKLLIAPSTGPTHLANGLLTKQIGFYSPIAVQSSKRWGPAIRNKNQGVFVPEVVCGERFKCALEKCPYYECMSSIRRKDVLQKCLELLND